MTDDVNGVTRTLSVGNKDNRFLTIGYPREVIIGENPLIINEGTYPPS